MTVYANFASHKTGASLTLQQATARANDIHPTIEHARLKMRTMNKRYQKVSRCVVVTNNFNVNVILTYKQERNGANIPLDLTFEG